MKMFGSFGKRTQFRLEQDERNFSTEEAKVKVGEEVSMPGVLIHEILNVGVVGEQMSLVPYNELDSFPADITVLFFR